AALALGAGEWRRQRGQDGSSLLVDVERHGRTEIVPGLDLSRTVGWFTSVFPVRLDLAGLDRDEAWAAGPALGGAVKRVKERLRSLPDGGAGYGPLRYLDAETGPDLARLPAPQVGFNYLGQAVVADSRTAADWGEVEDLPRPAPRDPGMPLPHALELTAGARGVRAGERRLRADWSWPAGLLSEADVRLLGDLWCRAL